MKVGGSAFEMRCHVNSVAATRVEPIHASSAALNPPALPATRPLPASVTPANNLTQKTVTSDPRDTYFLWLPSKLNPNQILQILRAALGGDLWRQAMLLQLMLDSWPMLRKCAHELREPVSNATYVVRPYLADGDEPSPKAKEKADLIGRAMKNWAPNQFSDEKGWNGMLYHVSEAMLAGLTMEELIWHPPTDWGSGIEVLPRAACWVHPRNISFGSNGLVGLSDQRYNSQMLPAQGLPPQGAPEPMKFLCAQFLGASGSVLSAGHMRALAWSWAGVMFNQEWMFIAAQNYGSPFVDYTYQSGMLKEDLDQLDSDIAKGLANRYIGHIEGTILNVNAPAPIGPDNPQRHLMEMADRRCCELLLGTEATTKATPGKLGDNDGGGAHDKTKQERVEGLAKWVGTEVLNHFVEAVLLANYGSRPGQIAAALSERPTIESDFTGTTDPMAQAQRDEVFLGNPNFAVLAEEIYKGNNLTVPEEGDLVLMGGKLCLMPPIETYVAPPPPGTKLGPDGKPLPLEEEEDDTQEPNHTAQAKLFLPVNRILAKATEQEKRELVPLLQAAETATHQNGEHAALTRHLLKIQNRK